MYQRVVLSVLIYIGLTLNQTVNADITGKVSDQAGGPIEGATLTLVNNGATATTGADGMYTLATTDVKPLPAPQSHNTGITLHKGFLNFSLLEAAPVKYEIFDVKGNLLKKKVLKTAQKGIYRFNIAENTRSTSLLVIKASIGKKEKTFKYLPLNSINSVYSQNWSYTPISGGLAKITAVADTIKVTADGYKEQAIYITSYDMELNVTMIGDCGEFTLMSNTLSAAIPTVGIIEWSYSKDVTSAHIEFGPQGSSTVMEAPVDLSKPNYRTLLLGMKAEREYHFRIVADNGTEECTSEDYTITTGQLPNGLLPDITVNTPNPAALAPGFTMTGTYSRDGSSSPAYVFDQDGDFVWFYQLNSDVTCARMSYDGQWMWMMGANVPESQGANVHRVSMDGSIDEDLSGPFRGANHSLVVLPDERVAFYAYSNSGCDDIKIYDPTTGQANTIINSGTAHGAGSPSHLNAMEYSADDQALVFSDLGHESYTKVSLTGQTVWVLGGPTSDFSGDVSSWSSQHGLHVLGLDRLVIFNNGWIGGSGSLAMEILLNTSSMTATVDWQYGASPGISNQIMGDVQRLDNGNTLVSYSTEGRMLEVDPSGAVVQDISWGLGGAYGYVTKRPTLYGPPPK